MIQFLILFSFLISQPINHNIKLTSNRTLQNQTILKTGWYYIAEHKTNCLRQLDQSSEKFYIDPKPIVSVKHFINAEIMESNLQGKFDHYIFIKFDPTGADAWSTATGKSINKKLALIIDDKLIYTPQVNTQITSGVSALNRGIYSLRELEEFTKLIKSEM